MSCRQAMIAIDAHVHLHDRAGTGEVLDHACANVRTYCRAPGDARSEQAHPVLLLAEIGPAAVFADLRAAAGSGKRTGAWSLTALPEAVSLMAQRGDGAAATLVAGRQVVSREGVEILALGTLGTWPDRSLDLREAVAAMSAAGALVVLPWGVGKWWGRRGERVRERIESAAAGDLCLGDNAGRPWFWPRPDLFARAERRGLALLPGTDPLPFPGEARRVGSFGLRLPGSVDGARPWERLLPRLRCPDAQSVPYGIRRGLVSFLVCQTLAMAVRRRPNA